MTDRSGSASRWPKADDYDRGMSRGCGKVSMWSREMEISQVVKYDLVPWASGGTRDSEEEQGSRQ